MPKKFQGENSKAAAAKARKDAAKQAEQDRQQQALEDALWADDDKHVQKKQQRKDDRMKKKQETAQRKAQNRAMAEEEMSSLKGAKLTPAKVTQAEILAFQEQKDKDLNKTRELMHDEQPLEENVNIIMGDFVDARSIEDAIAVLSVKEPEMDHHPEKRMKAAYQAFEDSNLPRLKAENPNLRLSQLKQLVKKEWMKSPENPMNQRHLAYNEK